ncbi:hypothetical protein AO376_0951 [Moraxella catarrhalis]|nr:hypothetical protein AO376_0951 [Moraxella catarrhalis]OAV18303.1 hypothetical protein AO374_1035 [Moraxella catarrhalis]
MFDHLPSNSLYYQTKELLNQRLGHFDTNMDEIIRVLSDLYICYQSICYQ